MFDATKCWFCGKTLAAKERHMCDHCLARTCRVCESPKPADGAHTCKRCRARA